MSAIDDFKSASRDLRQAIEWRALIGSPYSGGGGGIGSVVNAHCGIEVYHQAYNGATNYHASPNERAKRCVDKAAKEHAIAIIDRAIELLREQVATAAVEAEAERLEIANAIQKATVSA